MKWKEKQILNNHKELNSMKKKTIDVSTMFLFSYMIYIVLRFINGSALRDVVPFGFRRGSKILVILMLLFTIVIKRKMTQKAIMRTFYVVLIGVFVALVSKDANMFCIMLFLIVSQFVDFDKIIKTCMYTNIIMSLVVVSLCLLGKLQNHSYRHYSLILKKMTTVHSYGFLHYSMPTYIILFVSIMVLYYKRDKFTYLFMLVVNLISYFVFTTKLPFFLSILFIFLIVIFNDIKIFAKIKKAILKISSLLPLILLGLTYFFSKLFDKSKIWMVILNQVLGDRLYQGHVGLSKFGIGLLGKQFDMAGVFSLSAEQLGLGDYLYIDSDYLYMLLRYGVIFTLFIIIIYIVMLKKFENERYYFFVAWTMICLFFAVSNWCLYIIEFNPLIFAGMRLFMGKSITNKRTLKH